ncbi:hypothetical protein HYY74_01795 [Candidatus Woesearchaeota archaeon]|nr:hypothetical protein [Candidatus Woesearchaeota archaeon]
MNKLTVAGIDRFIAAYERFVVKLGMQFVNPVPAINDGYLHFLNASFDGLNLRQTEAKSLLEPGVEANFGAIQPCVRAEDAARAGYDLLHLGMFTILGTATWKFERLSPPQMARGTIGEFTGFYRDFLGMDPKRLKIFCFGGATVREASKGIISNDEYIPADGFSEELWREKGVRLVQGAHQ